jgi:hypothetical protein
MNMRLFTVLLGAGLAVSISACNSSSTGSTTSTSTTTATTGAGGATGTGGAGGTHAGGATAAGGAGGATAAGGAGGATAAGGAAAGGAGGGGTCATCNDAITPDGTCDPKGLTGDAKTNFDALETCVCTDKCGKECKTMCEANDTHAKADATCADCLQKNCATELSNCGDN